MRLNWKFIWLAILLLPLPFLTGGCGGVNAGTTVSPASFFLPGLLRNDVAPGTNAPSMMSPTSAFASAN
ncbi:MAG TPA: hypothetical protein VMO20_07430 [Candidatus Acidoferrum sp.]|nr:hypothetical protein [Candidatus Acidoferrum sp.]